MKKQITTPFGFSSTAAEVIEGIDLRGKHAIVTGGASGIGVETARALASAGAAVTLAVRNLSAGKDVAADIAKTTGNNNVQVAPLELDDPKSIQSFTAAWSGPLHLLINNAGVMAIPTLQRGPDGYEMQFTTNHLGHFALARGLHNALKAAGNARIVVVSSGGHFRSPVVFDDINFAQRPYDPWTAYGQSKTANILFAVEAAKRWKEDGITANALHPGYIHTNLQRYMPAEEPNRAPRPATADPFLKTVAQGAATSVFVATSPLLEGIGGRYFSDCNEPPVVAERPENSFGVASYALDPGNAQNLWDLSETIRDS